MSSGSVTSDPTIHDKPSVNGPLSGHSKTLTEALHMAGAAEVEFNPPKSDWMPKSAEFD